MTMEIQKAFTDYGKTVNIIHNETHFMKNSLYNNY